MQNFLRTAFRRLAHFIYRHPRAIVALIVVLSAGAAWLTVTRLVVINNTNALIRSTSPVHHYYLDYKAEFGVEEDYVIIVRSPDPERNRAVVQAVGQRLQGMTNDVHRVLYHLDFSRMEKRFLLFLQPQELKEIETEIANYAQTLKQSHVRLDLNSMLEQAGARFDDKYLRKGDNWKEFKPFIDRFVTLLDQLADNLEGKSTAQTDKKLPDGKASEAARDRIQDLQKLKTENEYLSYDEGRLLLITATPRQLSSGTETHTEAVAGIRAALAEIRAQNPDVTIGLTGEPVLGDDELQTSSRDSMLSGALAFILVAMLFFFSYREMARPALALLTLIFAVLLSLGFTVLSVGHLNLISQSFVAMVIGLGIDFGIQMMGRYEEELARGRPVLQALEETLPHTGLAVLTGGSTTAAAFYTMCFNDFIGLSEFGIIAGTGILICLALNLIVLPALYVLRDRTRSAEELQRQAGASHGFAGEKINLWLCRYPKSVLGVAAALTVLAVVFIPRVSFDYNLLNLQNPRLESVREEQALIHSPASSVIFAVSVANNVAEAREKIARFQALPSVAGTRSLTDLFPEGVDEKLVIIRRIVQSLQGINLQTDVSADIDVNKARTGLTDLLDKSQEGLKAAKKFVLLDKRARDAVETFGKLIPPLERAQAALNGLSQVEAGKRLHRYQVQTFDVMRNNLAWIATLQTDRGILPDDIPTELLQRFQSPNGKILIEILPKKDVWDRAANVEFVQQLRTVDPRVTGTPVQNYAYIELLRSSYVQAAWWALGAILVLIALHFRNAGAVLLTLLPLGLAIIWTLGWMGLTGHAFNPANVITLPLVIGIGVAYGVYTVDRWREDRRMDIFANSTGKAITLSALTTSIGFGSMLISSYRGLYSLGLLMFIGVLMCLLTSIVVLPQILSLRSRAR